MKGLDISREFYLQCGKPMIEKDFSTVADRIAVGLVGDGSECLGYDDEISRDHDFDAGFCLFITREDEARFGFALERAYSKLPREFMGLYRSNLSPAGGNRHGVIVIEDFYTKFLGAPTAPDTVERWLYTPSNYLRAASSGEVFCDPLGKFSLVRRALLGGYPEDIRLKKLAAHAAIMAQAGQYNYKRCMDRGETGAAQLAIFEFVRHAISSVYLLNNTYEPFYKWVYRGMRELDILSELEALLAGLTELENSTVTAPVKLDIIEDIVSLVIAEYKNQGLTDAFCSDLTKHAMSMQDKIKDSALRNMHLMDGI